MRMTGTAICACVIGAGGSLPNSTSTVVTMTLSATGSRNAPNVVAISNCMVVGGHTCACCGGVVIRTQCNRGAEELVRIAAAWASASWDATISALRGTFKYSI